MSEGGGEWRVRPATLEDLDWIAGLEIEAYTAEHAVARRKLDEWYRANPEGFSVIAAGGQRIGQLTILPLRPALLDGFVRGRILEQDIHGESLYSPAERGSVRNLHVESIIVRPQGGRAAPPLRALMCLGRDFMPLIRRVCEPENLEKVYALGASGRGERLMAGLGFSRVPGARHETESRALYVAKFGTLKANVCGLYHRRLGKGRT